MNKKKIKTLGQVYSTVLGETCPECERPRSRCCCRQKSDVVKGDGVVRVERFTKGRKGKGVTAITGLPLDAFDLRELARQLKAKCATGGTVKDGVIEIQGDQRERLMVELQALGYNVKRAGG